MSNTGATIVDTDGSLSISGDIVGGGLLAVLGLFHLFVLETGGNLGGLLLLGIWPLLAGAASAYFEYNIRPDRIRELPLVGAVAGVFGAIIASVVVLLTGWAGAWSTFIFATFGVELVTVTLGVAILFLITWTVASFVGAYIVQRSVKYLAEVEQ